MHEVSRSEIQPCLIEQCAHRTPGIVSHFKLLDPAFDTSRVCIKIPSTWSGLQACKVLESTGITTLATTLFTMVQTHLAGEVGCHYIAPYVNELKVHFEPGYDFTIHNYLICLNAKTSQIRRSQQSTSSLLSSSTVLPSTRHQNTSPASESHLDRRDHGVSWSTSYYHRPCITATARNNPCFDAVYQISL